MSDMSAFDLGRKYDVVMTLFSSIGYLKTPENITRAIVCFRNHLEPGGIVIIEPWFTPDTWNEGTVVLRTFEDDTLKVSRMGHGVREGNLSVLTFHYLIGTSEGVAYEKEKHELGLLTVEQMKECFAAAGLAVNYYPTGPSGMGLYTATGD